jgi:hypothetical protein
MPTKKKSKKSKPKKLKLFKIPVSWTVTANAMVEAKDLDEAIAIVEDPDFPNPTDTEYLSESFEVDRYLIDNEVPGFGEIK